MKICIAAIIAVVLLMPSVGNAQLRLALTGGPHSASVKETNSIPGWDSTTKPGYSSRGGFHFGALVEIPLGQSGRWFLHPSLEYQSKGRKFFQRYDTASAAITDTLTANRTLATNYIEIPFLIAHKFPLGKRNHFIVSAGPYISFFYNGKQSAETRLYNSNGFNKDEQNLEVGNAENKVKTIDYGFYGRAGFEFGSVLLTGFFSQGNSSFYQAPYTGTFKHKVIGATLGFWLNKPAPVIPKDRDRDGIEDKKDACPDQAGSALCNGCPDQDGDGIADIHDKCPDLAGTLKYNGCPIPDKDKDGVNDEQDNCPDVAGSAKYKGCPVPDSDGDGMNDEADACPDKPGVVEFNGCPIPDRDGDGLNDLEDKCPDVAGTKEDKGCPAIRQEVVEKVNFAARNIFFKINSDELAQGSFGALDDVAEVLKAHPNARMAISGHTDNSGKKENNQVLSEKRAKSVMKYLISKGIAEERLEAKGFGQDQPIAPNTTAEGKSQNRRVELKLLNE